MTTQQLREAFLGFFEDRDHLIRPSVSLLTDDPTTLYTGAGMQPYIGAFCGYEEPPAPRAASCQKCARETDIAEVGRTGRHQTFFEMLGNFSFGDYFKEKAIDLAWEFLVDVMSFPPERLWASVHLDDDEAEELWQKRTAIPKERIVRLGREDNWWPKERWEGPCGPCSEVYIDQGPEAAFVVEEGRKVSCEKADCKPGCECDRYLEVWNLVFQQFTEAEDGALTPLPAPGIDTGMGLERLALVAQGVESVYETQEFREVMDEAARVATELSPDGTVRYGDNLRHDTALKIIADHVRCFTFLMADGATPSNEGAGYMVRRLLRRAYRQGRILGVTQPFLYRALPSVAGTMGQQYPELAERQELTVRVVQKEEQRFQETLGRGLDRLEELVEQVRERGETALPGEELFRLHDTFGFHVDLAAEIAAERGMGVDREGFGAAMEAQKARSAHIEGLAGHGDVADLAGLPATVFVGYDSLEAEAEILAVLPRDEGDGCDVVLDRTPFYAERGGQMGDTGVLRVGDREVAVRDAQPIGEKAIAHHCAARPEELEVGATVQAAVDESRRRDIMRNHTATHLLHAALHEVLGKHALQSGSLVAPDRLRFDFAHYEAVSAEQLERIEDQANEWVLADVPVRDEMTSFEQARSRGAIALFGEKYGDEVRVLEIPGVSVELCGGTHCSRTGEIGPIRVVAESSISSGTRRLEAVTGRGALALMRQREQTLAAVAEALSCSPDEAPARLEAQRREMAELRKQVQAATQTQAATAGGDLVANAVDVDGAQLVAASLGEASGKALQSVADQVIEKLPEGAALVAGLAGGKVAFVAKVGQALVERGAHAGQLVKAAAEACGGGGGGKPDFARGSGKDASKVEAALKAAEEALRAQLGG